MKLKPINDHVIIEPIKEEKKTEGGIVLPETVEKEKPQKGKVIAIGPGKVENDKLRPMSVKEGDIVLFKKYAPDEFKINDKEYWILSEEDILAILEE